MESDLKKLFVVAETEEALKRANQNDNVAHVAFVAEKGNENIQAKGTSYQCIPSDGLDGQILMSKDGKGVWVDILDLYSYGVEWSTKSSDPSLTRIGNMTYHRTLPIQSQMKGCIYNPKEKKVIYWLDEMDWRLRKGADTVSFRSIAGDGATLTKASDVENLILSGSIENAHYYIDRYFTINNESAVDTIFQFVESAESTYDDVDTGTQLAFKIVDKGLNSSVTSIEDIFGGSENLTIPEDLTITLHSNLNGYDGEVMVYVPEFYIKSWDGEEIKSVRVSTVQLGDSWEHQPAVYISAYKSTVLNKPVKHMGYLSTLEADSAVSVMNTNDYCKGGNNSAIVDGSDPFKSLLNKPRTSVTRANFRTYARKAGKEILSYRQYKNILYWLWVIEYATFDSQAEFIPELDSNGLHQGGMGAGITNVSNFAEFKWFNPICPNGYMNEFGNGTAIKPITSETLEPKNQVNAIKWRGIENIFGDTSTNVDGIILRIKDGDAYYREVYTTDNPNLYSDENYQAMEKVAEENIAYSDYIMRFDLGETAEIIPAETISKNASHEYMCAFVINPERLEGELLTTLVFGKIIESTGEGGLVYIYNGKMDFSGSLTGFRVACLA